MAVIPSIDAEDAIFQVNRTKGLIETPPRTRRRFWRRSKPVEQRMLLELAIGRVVAAGEAYLVMRATRLLKPDLLQEIPPPEPPDTTTSLLRNAVLRLRDLKKVWRDQIGLDLETIPEWTSFALLRQLRHVLVHRLGYWQPGLDPKQDLADRVRSIGANPDLYRGQIPLVPDEFERSCDIALALVEEVDSR